MPKRKFEEVGMACLRSLNNACKRLLIEKAEVKGHSVLDIGFGKGGDIWKYIHSGVKTCVGIDMNRDFMDEAKQRLSNIKSNPPTRFHLLSPVHFEKPDQVKASLAALALDRFDALFAFFSIHTIFESTATLHNFCKTVDQHLSLNPEAMFICTYMCGEAILKWLQDEKCNHVESPGSFALDARPSDVSAITDESIGVKIRVDINANTVPLHEEYLVFTSLLIDALKPYHITLKETALLHTLPHASEAIDNLKRLNKGETRLATSSRYCIFVRNKN